MSKIIKIGKELVPVSEDVYKEYYKMARRERYMENDIKVGRINIEPKTGAATFIPSKEDSIERLMEQGSDFADVQAVEDIICDKAMLFILQKAMEELNHEEKELIEDLYYNNFTVRQTAQKENVSHVTIIKRHKKLLNKLKKYFL
ncbi:sigma-70 family RNA polymerase sigma factor [Clostridium autoethanogenum]|uniref:Sigma-70 family RNA polymerase sigma factor n=1 Tax=Clostridium autoethanogenum TaxID=84023 RepID=A0A3M0SXM7_9CLOT|nr:sigma factor-like helix-turn-helix DNA-binding protein [Clostridium autoethanogenum]RMD03214.1 sigma-70 family RNA polymerase sigma factor [Clostridium autoethanogenum]